MSTETPAQRRTRLVEQYAGISARYSPTIDAVLLAATKLADAVIAATPQEQEPIPAPRPSLQELGMQSTGLVDPPIKAGKLPPHPLLKLDGYPSEAESRLIELVEYCIEGMCGILRAETARDRLAAIKRDLGVK